MPRPLVGLSVYLEHIRLAGFDERAAYTPSRYVTAIDAAGAIPVLLPPSDAEPREVLSHLDGLVLIGGSDVDPALYGAEPHPRTQKPRPQRDRWEVGLARAALDADLPLLAICRGHQLLNVTLGGSLHQHLEEVVNHTGHMAAAGGMSRNQVDLVPGSRLAAILGRRASVLCHHHQAVDRVGEGLVVAARAPDGTIEAMEVPGKTFAFAVQWHPEEDPGDGRLFAAFVQAALGRAQPPIPQVACGPWTPPTSGSTPSALGPG
jgi:putative glutamine amidotransferase